MGTDHALYSGRDQITSGQNVSHSLMSLSYTVAGGHCRKYHRCPTSGQNPRFYLFAQLVEYIMAGGSVGITVRNGNYWFSQLTVRKAHRLI